MDYVLTAHLPGGRQRWLLPEGETHIGRSRPNPVLLPDESVSKLHALIRRTGDRIEIMDLDSKNGTRVNQRSVTSVQRIQPGDLISIGNVSLQVDRVDHNSTAPYLSTPDFDATEVQSLPPAPRGDGALATLLDLGEFLVRRHDRHEICEKALDKAWDLVGYDLASILLLGDSGLTIESQRHRGRSLLQPAFSHSILERVLHEKSPLRVTDRFDPTVSMVQQRIRSALVFFLVLFLLRVVLRRRWLASVVFVALLATPALLVSHHPLLEAPVRVAVYSIVALAVVRFGLVPLAAGILTVEALLNVPVSASLSSWYAGSMVFVFSSILALAAWGFYTSLAGQRLIRGELFE